ncbi:MAG: hypothetical protein PHO56_02205 [Patescibacteria group bacterium]|nr:hypothetical protein [Patescibacteria group bacterium]
MLSFIKNLLRTNSPEIPRHQAYIPQSCAMRFIPHIGEEFYYFKWCGVVVGDIWCDHKNQKQLVRRGMAAFRTVEEAKSAYYNHDYDSSIQ